MAMNRVRLRNGWAPSWNSVTWSCSRSAWRSCSVNESQDVRLGPGERLAERLDLGDPFVGEGRPVRARRGARAVVEGVMRRGDDRGDGGHIALLGFVRVYVDGVTVDSQVG